MANRVALGHLGSGQYGLKISKAGFNVLTADDKDLIFSSLWSNYSVVVQKGVVGGTGNVSFTDQGYVPVAFVLAPASGSGVAAVTYSYSVNPHDPSEITRTVGPIWSITRTVLAAPVGSQYFITNMPLR